MRLGGREDDLYLTEDLSVQCWKSTHAQYIVFLALPLCVLYVVGVPALVYWILDRNMDLVRIIVETTGKKDETPQQEPLEASDHKEQPSEHESRRLAVVATALPPQDCKPADESRADFLEPDSKVQLFQTNYVRYPPRA